MNRKHCLVGIVAIALALGGVFVPARSAVAEPPESAFEGNLSLLPNTPAIWTSGWVLINQNQTLTFNHNLGLPPERLAVDLWFQDSAVDGIGRNRANYGGLEADGNLYGAYWRALTANTIQVHRLPNDEKAHMVRVRVWVAPTPDYDSGWTTINQGQTLTFNHNLNATPDKLNMSLWFSSTTYGIHHFAYGGLTNGPSELGAYWFQLGNNTVKVQRRPDDHTTEQVRVVVSRADPPAYDSGLQSIGQGAKLTLNHNLNWQPEMLMVRGECYEPSTAGYNQIFAGGDESSGLFRGAHLQELTANSVAFVRRANDTACPQVRVIIYEISQRVYLPVIVRGS